MYLFYSTQVMKLGNKTASVMLFKEKKSQTKFLKIKRANKSKKIYLHVRLS